MRRSTPLWIALILVLTAAGACGPGGRTAVAPPDLILFGGRVLTLQTVEPDPVPSAVAIRDGRILQVGDDAEILSLADDADTRRIDLGGATVIPGFSDSHCHFYGLGKALAQIDLNGTASAAEVCERVAAAVLAAPGDGWLEGRGWDQNDWPVQAYPDRALLDAVAPGRPVLLRRVDGHAAWANSVALARAGIDADTPDPAGGAIVRDAQGNPTGILIDNGVDLVRAVVPEPSAAEVRRRLHLAMAHCLRHGITGVHDAGITWERGRLLAEMAADGDLGLRVYAMVDDLPESLAPALADGPVFTGDGLLTIRAVKLYADGALGSRGALLLADYSDQPGHHGLAVTPADHLREVARAAGAAGFQVCTHAIGDGGNRLALDIYQEVLGELQLTDARWRIEHAQILAAADLPRFAELGVIAAMQPTHCTSDMDWAGTRLGAGRLDGAYAWRSLLDSGAHVCFGTDFPVEAVDPLAGLYAARTRTHPDGTPPGGWHPEQALDGRTALELYTAGSAYASFREHELGRVRPGFHADLTVLSGDPVACEPEHLHDLQVVMTIVAGRVAYER